MNVFFIFFNAFERFFLIFFRILQLFAKNLRFFCVSVRAGGKRGDGRQAYYMLCVMGVPNTTKKISKIPIFGVRGDAVLIENRWEGEKGVISGEW